MTLDEFVAKYDGKRITAPGGLGGECVDLPNQYILDCFNYPHQWKNAIDWWGVSPDLFTWVKNDLKDLTQIPPRGAIMVWGPNSGVGTGPLGHLDVVLSPGSYQFTGFDQNWPLGSYAHHQIHSYAGVIGWGIPKALQTTTATTTTTTAAAAATAATATATTTAPVPAEYTISSEDGFHVAHLSSLEDAKRVAVAYFNYHVSRTTITDNNDENVFVVHNTQ